MASSAPGRGIFDIAKLARLCPRVTRVKQRLSASSSLSFRYHVPRRIADSRSGSSYHNATAIHSGAITVRREPPLLARNLQAPCPPQELNQQARASGIKQSNPHLPDTATSPILKPSLQQWRNYGKSGLAHRPLGQHMQRAFSATNARESEGPERRNTNPAAPQNASQASSNAPPSDGGQHQSHLMDRFHMPHFHRPTKEELLAAATGFWSRLRVRFKWFSIRSVRPYNMDEIGGFITWILLGHVVWIVVGTTTFFSLAILAINTVFAQETLATWIGNYLTKSTGVKVVFESAVVPKWEDGVITFKNVFVSRRPGRGKRGSVTKGSPEAAAAAVADKDIDPLDDGNYTQFDITVGEVDVTLSFRKWFNSKGLLQNVEVKHVRGVIDRTHVDWTGVKRDPKSYRQEHNPGDFEIDNFKIEDLLLTIHQPKGFRPFPVSVYNAELPRLRRQWLFYDMLSATSVTGEFDRSLFTIHPRQTDAYTGASLQGDDEDSKNNPWLKQSRIRIDGLNIDHLNRGVEGPFGWIHEGNVDIVADIMIPADSDESVLKVMSDFYDRMEATVTPSKHKERSLDTTDRDPNTPTDVATSNPQAPQDKRFLIMDLRVHLNDVRAVVPLFTRDLSYVNNALIRPIVAYINSRRTFIPINCRVVKHTTDFDGSWTIFDSGLMDDLSAEVYEAFAKDVMDEQARMRRFKKVGLWSLQLAVQAIFMGMAGNIA